MRKFHGEGGVVQPAFEATFPWGTVQVSQTFHERFGFAPLGEVEVESRSYDLPQLRPVDIRLLSDADNGVRAPYPANAEVTELPGSKRLALDMAYRDDTDRLAPHELGGYVMAHHAIWRAQGELNDAELPLVYRDMADQITSGYVRRNLEGLAGSVISTGIGAGLAREFIYNVDSRAFLAGGAVLFGSLALESFRELRRDLRNLGDSLPDISSEIQSYTGGIGYDLHRWFFGDSEIHTELVEGDHIDEENSCSWF